MENHVQAMTAAMPKATPIQNSRPVAWPERCMYSNSVQFAMTRPAKMTHKGGRIAPQEMPRPSR